VESLGAAIVEEQVIHVLDSLPREPNIVRQKLICYGSSKKNRAKSKAKAKARSRKT
jgi:hypothetical protein